MLFLILEIGKALSDVSAVWRKVFFGLFTNLSIIFMFFFGFVIKDSLENAKLRWVGRMGEDLQNMPRFL